IFSRIASSISGSAFLPACTRNIPAMVRTAGSSEPSDVTSVRAADGDPVVRHRTFETNSRAVWRGRTSLAAVALEHRGDVVLLPVRRIVRGEMVEPERQDVLGDPRIVEPLTPAIRKNDQIQMNSDRDDLLRVIEVRRVLRPVHGTREKHHAPDVGSRLIGEHGDAASVAVSVEI